MYEIAINHYSEKSYLPFVLLGFIPHCFELFIHVNTLELNLLIRLINVYLVRIPICPLVHLIKHRTSMQPISVLHKT